MPMKRTPENLILLREYDRGRRYLKKVKGECGRSGCHTKTKNYYCTACAKKYADEKRKLRQANARLLAEAKEAMIILQYFEGKTLLEKVRAAAHLAGV